MAGHLHPKQDNVSGNNRVPVVDLVGAPMIALAHAIPAVAKRTGRDVIVVGGLAVVCRLTRPYRATSDLDTSTGAVMTSHRNWNSSWPAVPNPAAFLEHWSRHQQDQFKLTSSRSPTQTSPNYQTTRLTASTCYPTHGPPRARRR